VYATSLLDHLTDSTLPKHPSTETAAVIVPLAVAAAAIALTGRWLKTTEVA
jgi:hypothetical protein